MKLKSGNSDVAKSFTSREKKIEKVQICKNAPRPLMKPKNSPQDKQIQPVPIFVFQISI